jgi:hypothetical protein
MRRIDDQADEAYLKALVYGNPGTGKTSFGVSAPKPLILLSERQGVPHVRAAARRLGRHVPPTLHIERADDLRLVLRALMSARGEDFMVSDREGKPVVRLEGYWPETVVLDSFTDMNRLLADEIDRESPPKLGKDNLPVRSDRFWGVFMDRTSRLIRTFRDIPYHLVILALLDDRTEGEGESAERHVGPQCEYKRAQGTLAAAVNVVGVTYRRARTRKEQVQEIEYEYGITTCAPGYYLTKPYRPLRDSEVPDFTSWVQRVLHGAPEPTAPEPAAAGDYAGDGEVPAAAPAEEPKRKRGKPQEQAAAAEGGAR